MLTILSDDTQHRYSIPFIRYLSFSQSVKLSKPCRTAVHRAVDCSPPLIKLESTALWTGVHCAQNWSPPLVKLESTAHKTGVHCAQNWRPPRTKLESTAQWTVASCGRYCGATCAAAL